MLLLRIEGYEIVTFSGSQVLHNGMVEKDLRVASVSRDRDISASFRGHRVPLIR